MMFPKGKQVAHRRRRKGRKIGFKKTEADRWFSIYIRLRDIKQNEMCECCTCRKWLHWKEMTCGHFQKRGKPMTRFNEENCSAQCNSCNGFRDGYQYKHAKFIDKKYGKGTADKLEQLAEIRGQKDYTDIGLKEISREYREKARKLAIKKGIEL